jgi:hypothetical protein
MDNGYMQTNGGKGNPPTNPQYSVSYISGSCLPTSSQGNDGYNVFYITYYQNPYYNSITVTVNYVNGSGNAYSGTNTIYVWNYSPNPLPMTLNTTYGDEWVSFSIPAYATEYPFASSCDCGGTNGSTKWTQY